VPLTIEATPGHASANSYGTVAEANAYFEARVPLDPVWPTSGEPAKAALIMATRVLDSLSVARRRLYRDGGGGPHDRPYYVTSRAWTGTVATATQALAWPRIGMFDRLGRAIADTVVPQDLKNAQFELAGQLLIGDRTLDNDISLQGITSVKAGSVAVTFRDLIARQVLPDAVLELLVPSWLTDEIITPATRATLHAL
jgi:hypothetical protein